jgi:hypothetical protein
MVAPIVFSPVTVKNWTLCLSHIENALKSRRTKTKCNTYLQHYKNYILYVSDYVDPDHIENNDDDGPLFITQHNVERYFEEIIVYKESHSEAVINKILLSLSWALKTECRTYNDIIKTPTLQASIEEQQQHNHSFMIAKLATIDPHRGIEGLSFDSQNLAIIRQIWDPKRKYSNDLQFAYCWGTNNGVRGASIRAMQLRDSNISSGYGPNDEDSSINRTLLLIFRSGMVHKERYTILQQTGVTVTIIVVPSSQQQYL